MARTTAERIRDAQVAAHRAALKLKTLRLAQDNEQRRLAARRKVILGGWLLANRPELVQEIVLSLRRDCDRAVFVDWQPTGVASTDVESVEVEGDGARS